MLSAAPYHCRGGVPSPPGGLGWRNSPFCWRLALPCAAVPPHFFGLAQRNGVEPQRKTLMGWWRPREVSGPARLSHSRGRCHSAAKVSASRTDCITRPKGEGFGLAEIWPSKSFLPRFFTKKAGGVQGRSPGRAPQRAEYPHAQRSAGGGKGGTLAGGSPFAGGPRRPQPARRRGAGGELRNGSSGTPTPTAGGKRAVCRVIYCETIRRLAGVEPCPYRGAGSCDTNHRPRQ